MLFKKKAKRVFIFNTHPKSKRLVRFREELEKRGIEVRIINSYSLIITDRGIFYQDEEIVFEKGDVVWFVANPMINHYLAEYIEEKYAGVVERVWPDANAVKLSDKFLANSFFASIGVATPKTVLLNTAKVEKMGRLAEAVGGWPVVMKKCKGSMGATVKIVNSEIEVKEFLQRSFAKGGKVPFRKNSYLLQEFINESAGTDFRVLGLNGKVLGGIKRIAQDGGFKANISLGGKAEIIEVEPELAELAKKIMREGRIFYAGIDFLKTKNGYLALEINTSSQFKGFEEATGMNIAGMIIDELIK